MATPGKGFGSFHTEDVEDLVRLPDSLYKPPPTPVEVPPLPLVMDFGEEARRQLFLLDSDWVFINHGAFGAANRISFEVAQAYQLYLEKQPLRFIDRYVLPALCYVTRELASFVKCPAWELALVFNATTALNAVMHSVELQPGDSVFVLDTAYGSVKKMARNLCHRCGADYVEGTLRFPIATPDEIIRQVSEQIQPNTRLAIFDHISSNTAILFPVKQLAQLCHERGSMVLIDGAHGLLQCDVNLEDIGADFYIGNCHKWLTCPKGAGFLYAKSEHHKWLRASNISHGWVRGFISEFMWSGTHDYSALLSINSALSLWKYLGHERVDSYCTSLLAAAAELLCDVWESQTLVPLNSGLSRWMILVQLPQDVLKDSVGELPAGDRAEAIQDQLYHEFRIEVPVKTVNENLYVRISAHIYNTLSQYQELARAVNSMRAN